MDKANKRSKVGRGRSRPPQLTPSVVDFGANTTLPTVQAIKKCIQF
jgi:hypothetical protein